MTELTVHDFAKRIEKDLGKKKSPISPTPKRKYNTNDILKFVSSLPPLGVPSGNSTVYRLTQQKIIKLTSNNAFFDHVKVVEYLLVNILKHAPAYAPYFNVDFEKYFTVLEDNKICTVEKIMIGDVAENMFREHKDHSTITQFIHSMLLLIRFMYTHGVNHNDMHLGNIFINNKQPCIIDGVAFLFTPIIFDFDWTSIITWPTHPYKTMVMPNEKLQVSCKNGTALGFLGSHLKYTLPIYKNVPSPSVDLAHLMSTLLKVNQSIVQPYYDLFCKHEFNVIACLSAFEQIAKLRQRSPRQNQVVNRNSPRKSLNNAR